MDTKKLRQKILDLAIHGKLVPQDPNDEPASVLLERIKAEKERLIKEGKIKKSKKSTKASDTPHYENVPFEVPSSWVWTTLGEISNYGECNNVSVDSITDDDWVLELEDLEKDTAKIIQTLSRSKRSIKGVRHRFNKGDILYSKLRTYLNKVLVAPQSGYCTTEIMPFNSYCNVSSYYLNHVLRSAYFLDYTQQCGYGVKMPRLSTTDACNGMIPLPPLAEQKRIVKEIEHWFSLIDVIESGKEDLQATIKQAKSKILDLAIHGKLVPQDPNDEPASELLKRINSKAEITCDNGHSGKLPQGWCNCKISDVSISLLGKTLDRGKNTGNLKKYLCAVNVKWGTFELSTVKEMPIEATELERYSVKFGDLMVCEGGDVGRAAIWTYNSKMYYQNALHRIRFKENISAHYFLYSLMYLKLIGVIDDVCKGVTIKHLTQNAMNTLKFNLPPIAEQQRIVQKIEELFSILDNIQNALEV